MRSGPTRRRARCVPIEGSDTGIRGHPWDQRSEKGGTPAGASETGKWFSAGHGCHDAGQHSRPDLGDSLSVGCQPLMSLLAAGYPTVTGT
jgi:hypothetical protein